MMSAQLQSVSKQDTAQGTPAPVLASLKKGDAAIVTGLLSAEGADMLALKIRLLELGFAPGEKVRVVAESFPSRDPMAVRLGNTTFALRRHEAALIQVERTAA
jgi:ferrous iron transport protein A